jgi:hypothetical protein
MGIGSLLLRIRDEGDALGNSYSLVYSSAVLEAVDMKDKTLFLKWSFPGRYLNAAAAAIM